MIIDCAALFRNKSDENARKAYACYKTYKDKHAGLELYFEALKYFFVEIPTFSFFTAEKTAA